MARLTDRQRAELPDRAFAYIDSKGRRKLPIMDESHVRNALARFNQVRFESDEARDLAMQRLLRAAKRHGIVPVGFFTRQLRAGRGDSERGARLPSGEVTLLFTDIEGSTAHLTALGGTYPELLERVRATIRRAIGANGGHEVEVRADEYFAVFEEASSALSAAVTIQRSLGRARRVAGQKVRVRVRIGLHTGAVMLTDLGYVGLAVHAAARVCAAAHGGQIVASAELLRAAAEVDGIGFEPLGSFRLAGLPGTHRLHQVTGRGLGADFPLPRADRVTH